MWYYQKEVLITVLHARIRISGSTRHHKTQLDNGSARLDPHSRIRAHRNTKKKLLMTVLHARIR
jgi:hypothetical protein